MRRFSKISLIVIFISIIYYIQSVDADQTTTMSGYHGDEEYKVHLQKVVRDKNNQLIYVAESTGIERFQTYLPNGILEPQWIDTIFDRTLMENYQSVIIYGKKYEKVQYQLTFENNFSKIIPVSDSFLKLCANLEVHGSTCIISFVAKVPMLFVQEDDVVTDQWTILRIVS